MLFCHTTVTHKNKVQVWKKLTEFWFFCLFAGHKYKGLNQNQKNQSRIDFPIELTGDVGSLIINGICNAEWVV